MKGGALHVADWHLDDQTHDDGLGWRKAEAKRIADAIFKAATENAVDVVIFDGDLYHSRRPRPWAIQLFKSLVDRLKAAGVQVRVITGNHDADSPTEIGPLGIDFLDEMEYVSRPCVEEFGRSEGKTMFQVAYFPWVSRAQLAAATGAKLTNATQHAMMADAFTSMVQGNAATLLEDCPTFAVTHFTIGGATWNSGVQPDLGATSEFMVPRTAFPAELGTVFAGHIHKPQTLSHIDGLADVIYVGSAIHHDFGEDHESSMYLWRPGNTPESAETAPTRIVLPATEFVTIEVDNGEFIQDDFGDLCSAIVRFKGTMPAGPESQAKLAIWTEQVIGMGALKVAANDIRYARHEHRAVSTITTSTTPDDALEEFIGVVGGDYEARKDALTALHLELVEEATCDQ